MAKRKVIWSLNAQKDRKEILQYWKQRNKSAAYSKKLRKLFSKAIEQLRRIPELEAPRRRRMCALKW